jgi:hypothetical protein
MEYYWPNDDEDIVIKFFFLQAKNNKEIKIDKHTYTNIQSLFHFLLNLGAHFELSKTLFWIMFVNQIRVYSLSCYLSVFLVTLQLEHL